MVQSSAFDRPYTTVAVGMPVGCAKRSGGTSFGRKDAEKKELKRICVRLDASHWHPRAGVLHARPEVCGVGAGSIRSE